MCRGLGWVGEIWDIVVDEVCLVCLGCGVLGTMLVTESPESFLVSCGRDISSELVQFRISAQMGVGTANDSQHSPATGDTKWHSSVLGRQSSTVDLLPHCSDPTLRPPTTFDPLHGSMRNRAMPAAVRMKRMMPPHRRGDLVILTAHRT